MLPTSVFSSVGRVICKFIILAISVSLYNDYHKLLLCFLPIQATLELQKSALKPGTRVVIIDDVLAIGGTMSSAAKLCKQASLDVIGAGVLLEVAACNGGVKLDEMGLKWFSILKCD